MKAWAILWVALTASGAQAWAGPDEIAADLNSSREQELRVGLLGELESFLIFNLVHLDGKSGRAALSSKAYPAVIEVMSTDPSLRVRFAAARVAGLQELILEERGRRVTDASFLTETYMNRFALALLESAKLVDTPFLVATLANSEDPLERYLAALALVSAGTVERDSEEEPEAAALKLLERMKNE